MLSTNTYHYGDTVAIPATPTKAADGTYTYTFSGWDKEIVACVADAIYTATYSSAKIETNETPDVNNPSDDTPEDENEGLSGGAIAGIAVASTVATGTGGFSLFWFVIKKKKFSDLVKIIKKK